MEKTTANIRSQALNFNSILSMNIDQFFLAYHYEKNNHLNIIGRRISADY